MLLGDVRWTGSSSGSVRPSHAGGGEASADAWERRLSGIHFRKRYWYLRTVVKLSRFTMRLLLRWSRHRKDGYQAAGTADRPRRVPAR